MASRGVKGGWWEITGRMRRRGNVALRDMDRLLNAAEALAHTGSWSWRPPNRLVWSAGMYPIFGLPPGKPPGLEEFLERVHPDDRPALAAYLASAREGVVERRETEFRVLAPDGDERTIAAVVDVRTDSRGQFVELIGAVQDVTERKRTEQALRKALEERQTGEAQLQQSQRLQSIGTLAGGVAHDFNNLLLAISGNTQLALEDCAPDHPAYASLTEIRHATARAAALVRSLLTFSRASGGEKHPLQVQHVIVEALRLLRAAVPAMIAIRFTPPETLPNVNANAGQLHQIIMNLGANAAHAIGQRMGVIEVSAVEVVVDAEDARRLPGLREESRYVRVTMSDDGAGMSRQTIERIFEPFFTTKPSGVGTGLGLSVVHGIVKNHGGAIEIDSEPGGGARVSIYLPITEAAVASTTPLAAPAPGVRGKRVLYIDDEDVIVSMMSRLLGRLEYRVTGFTDPELAVDDFKQRPHAFDVVVTDLSMPIMSGFDAAREILQIRPDIPVVLTSGYVRPEDAQQAARIGIKAIVLKPNTVEEMARELFAIFSASTSA